MGVTIHYRGAIADLDRVEDFEDRVLDLALELGGQAQIWRTASDRDPSRMVRGVVLNLCPGQDTTSLLLSPEGWLINLFEIEDAENGELAEMPWCFVKTQFGSFEGHVALVEMLAALKAEFFPNLEVQDEGDYWETRDVNRLAGKLAFLKAAIEHFSQGLEQHGLSAEAAEDPEIQVTRIERVAGLVQKTLKRPAEHPPVHWRDDDTARDDEGHVTPEEEARWDAAYKKNRRMQERVHRAVERHLAEGKTLDEAHDAAIHEETAAGLPEDDSGEDDYEVEEDDDWRASLPDEVPLEPFEDDEAEDHPLQKRAMQLYSQLKRLLPAEGNPCGNIDVLMHGALEISGGLAQALGCDDEDGETIGLSIVQLKRAMRGAAFALGALFPLRSDGVIDEGAFDELRGALKELQSDIYEELRRRRGA